MTDSLDIENTLKPETATKSADSGAYTLSPGDTLGQYKIIRPLGRGGMGEVYLCEHAILTTRHAIKLLPAERSASEGFLQRFHDEARVMAKLDHPGIVKVTHADVQSGRHYLVMDFVGADGTDEPFDLEDALATAPENRLPPEIVARLGRKIAESVEAAHEAGVVHRDLKPANVLLTSRDLTKAEARVADFGLARLLGEDWLLSRVDSSMRHSLSVGRTPTLARPRAERDSKEAILGTYEYMSPEQRDGKEADARSDIYALGVMLYRMVTGKRLMGRAKAASKLVEGLDESWDNLIDTCLEESPGDRPASMAAVADALERFEREALQQEKAWRENERERQRRAAKQAAWERESLLLRQRAEEQRERARQAAIRHEREEAARVAAERPQKQREAAKKARQRSAANRRKSCGGAKNTNLHRICSYATPNRRLKRIRRFAWVLLLLAALAGGAWMLRDEIPLPPVVEAFFQPHPELVSGRDWRSPATGMEFVWIPQMNLWVGKYEVTNGEYRKKERRHDSKSFKKHRLNGNRQPVVYVNFDNAKAYAKWLTRKDRPWLRGARYRLPSEREWMTYAQCGERREYPWGHEWPPPSGRAGNYHGQEGAGSWDKISGYHDGFPVTAPVDRLWANPWGLYGVGGNVWEACARDSSGESFGGWRGASWYDMIQAYLRCSYRFKIIGSGRSKDIGFRLVLARP